MSKKGKQFSSRFWDPYDELVVNKAREARLKPNQLVRLATMSFVDSDLLALHTRMRRIEEHLLIELQLLREELSTLKSKGQHGIGITEA